MKNQQDTQQDSNEFSSAADKIERNQFGGTPANAFFIPIVVVLAILHIIVISLMLSIFSQSAKLSQAMQDSSTYITDATSLLAGTSVLSETTINYVLMPITTSGEPNIAPLVAYTNEMRQTDHRGDQVEARFETYQVSDQARQNIKDAANSANALVDLQSHALALVCAVHPLPNTPELADLELPELSAEEASLSDDEKTKLAQTLMLDTDFGTNKQSVSSNVNEAVANIRATSGEQAAATAQSIGVIRTLLVTASVFIVIFLCFLFVLLYRLLILPLGRFSRLIINGEPLDEKHGLREVRLLAGSYNSLLHRRDALEGILREAAETDTLTGLPNRYSFRQQLLDIEKDERSITVLLFDVDNLKATNDTQGHAAGDDLIRRAAHCILSCFASTDDGKCYRFAGDEFAAIIRGLDEKDLPAFAQRFKELQAQNNVSISWGYAYSETASGVTIKALMDEADHHMYLMKEEVHNNGHHYNASHQSEPQNDE